MNGSNDNLLNLYVIMINESKQEWINYVTTNRLLQMWTRPIPLVKLYGDVNKVLTSLYQSSNFFDAEVYAVLHLWDVLTSYLEDAFGNINVEVKEWISLLIQAPVECYTENLSERVGNLWINTLLVCLSEGIEA